MFELPLDQLRLARHGSRLERDCGAGQYEWVGRDELDGQCGDGMRGV